MESHINTHTHTNMRTKIMLQVTALLTKAFTV